MYLSSHQNKILQFPQNNNMQEWHQEKIWRLFKERLSTKTRKRKQPLQHQMSQQQVDSNQQINKTSRREDDTPSKVTKVDSNKPSRRGGDYWSSIAVDKINLCPRLLLLLLLLLLLRVLFKPHPLHLLSQREWKATSIVLVILPIATEMVTMAQVSW